MRSSLLLLFATIFALSARAQVNDKGTFHAGVGLNLGVHATQYEQTLRVLGVAFTEKETDGAATVTVPLRFHYGFARIFSLGLFVEPGSYLDSSATRSNGLTLVGVEPRFYLVNNDRFAWMAGLQFGGAALRIDDTDDLGTFDSRYAGSVFGLSTGLGMYFNDMFGLHLDLRYVATNMPLREFTRNGVGVDLNDFEANLRTSGVTLGAALMFKF